MEQPTEQPISGDLIELALRDLADGNTEQLRETLADAHPAETAGVLEGMPPEQRSATWELVPEDGRGEVLVHVHDEARSSLVDEMDHAELITAAEQMDDEDLAEVLDELTRRSDRVCPRRPGRRSSPPCREGAQLLRGDGRTSDEHRRDQCPQRCDPGGRAALAAPSSAPTAPHRYLDGPLK